MDEHKFLVTEECARLARWLRLMGYDAATGSARQLPALYRLAYNESRAIVTRNRRVGANGLVRVIHLRSQRLEEQLGQLMRELRLKGETAKAFSRCDVCNVSVEPVDRALVKGRVPPYVFETQQAFHRCPSCRRIYWAATHWQRACRFFDRLREEASHA